MPIKQLEKVLIESFTDFTLSTNEKYELKTLLKEYNQDSTKLSFIRNRAFLLVKEKLRLKQVTQQAALKWLENVVKTIDSSRPNISSSSSSYFSPGDQCANKIIALLNRAITTVDVCVFTISDNNISKAITAAHQRGIKVRIVTDNDKSNDLGSDVYSMAKQGLNIKMDCSPSHMHHKFAVIDNQHLINGSFNWTRSASKYNQENIVVTSELSLIKSFQQRFDRLWQECQKI